MLDHCCTFFKIEEGGQHNFSTRSDVSCVRRRPMLLTFSTSNGFYIAHI